MDYPFIELVKDKARSLRRIPIVSVPTLFSLLFGGYVAYASIRSAFHTNPEQATWTIVFIGVYGIINCVLVWKLEKTRSKQYIAIDATEALHKAIEKIRQYRTSKHDPTVTTSHASLLVQQIARAGEAFYERYVIHQYNRAGDPIRMTIKFLCGDKLRAVRIAGDDAPTPPHDYEYPTKSGVFQALSNTKQSGHIYVRDTQAFRDEERKLIGTNFEVAISQRAREKEYRTFIAIPVNTGNLREHEGNSIKKTIGLVGLDLKSPNAFGKDLTELEKHALYAFADAISELAYEGQIDSAIVATYNDEEENDGSRNEP